MTPKQINKIYDSFPAEGKNMTRTAFHKEIHALTSQAGIQRDLRDIELRKARERSNKINIDRKINGSNTDPAN